MVGANLALISTPGEYAASEAFKALGLGLNVMLFSDNVELKDEIALKRFAQSRDLIVMGPDCGTAIINGTPLAFANVVRRGVIGVVGATGISDEKWSPYECGDQAYPMANTVCNFFRLRLLTL